MPLTLTQKTAPNKEPFELDDAKLFLRVTEDDEDLLIQSILEASREYVEIVTRRQLMPATWELRLDCFPPSSAPIRLPRPPLQSITSISYTDANGDSQTFTDYQVDIYSEPPRLSPSYGVYWPTVKAGTMNVVTIEYVSGYTNAATIPRAIFQAMRLMIADAYEHREAQILGTIVSENSLVDKLLWPYRVL